MKLKYVKFSDERRREFCVKTIIAEDNGNVKVYKKAIFDEGTVHIRSIVDNAGLLGNYYDVEICNAVFDGDTAGFDYIKGQSMEDRYIAAMKKQKPEEIKRLLLIHKGIILGKKENETVFSQSRQASEIFGDCSMFEGKKALRCCNYDAIAGNIIFVSDNPVFIDYEWVFNFPVPVDVVLYHCIHNFYEHYPEMEDVVSFNDAMECVGVISDMDALEKTYRSFFDYVISDGSEEGFALMKAICLKRTRTLQELDHENLVNICECDRLQGVISDLNGQLLQKAGLEEQLEALKQSNKETVMQLETTKQANAQLENMVHEYEYLLQHKTSYIIAQKIYGKLRSIGNMICKKE